MTERQSLAARLQALAEWVQPRLYLLEGRDCILGRSSGCDVVGDQMLVSRRHARIEPSGARYVLTDLGSANGTFVNGRRLSEPHLLASDDVIGLGSTSPALRFEDPDETRQLRDPLYYDERALQIYLGREQVPLTQPQLRLLLRLMQRPGGVCTREECAAAVWGAGYEPGADAGRLDQLTSTVRQALRRAYQQAHGADKEPPDFIEARRGIGYVLEI
jgi:DNA-binding response OmpR family regulator